MTILELRRSARRPPTPGTCLTARPGAGNVINAMFALTVLLFLLGLLALV
jgi:hypothetical protein